MIKTLFKNVKTNTVFPKKDIQNFGQCSLSHKIQINVFHCEFSKLNCF